MSFRLLCAAGCAVALTVTTLHPLVLARQAPARADVMPPPRAGLEPITFPPLDGLEPAVASHLREARSELERAAATAQRGDLARAYGAFGRIFHAYEFFAAAEAAYVNAARLAPGESDWPHLLGYLYQQTGRLEEAAASLGAARRARPGDRRAGRAAGRRLRRRSIGCARRASSTESVLTALPAAAHQGLGEVALRERRYREALEHFRAALDRVPQATALHYSMAMAYRGLGRLDEARAHLARRGTGGIVAADPVVDSLQSLVRGERLLVIQGSRFYAAGRYQEAADAFERALAVAPSSVPARVNLAAALLERGDASRAVEHLDAALALSPGDRTIGRQLVSALLRLDCRDAAINVLRPCSAPTPTTRTTTVGLAILLAERQRIGEAIAILDNAHRRLPARAATATTLARLLASSPELSRRDGRRALDLAMEVYRTEPGPAHAETVALALAELNRCAEALDWMRRAVSAAEAEGDAGDTARLRTELPRFEAPSCRAPGR